MANRNKRAGTEWESAIRDYLNRELGQVDEDGRFWDVLDPYNVKRQAQEGARDVGDLWAHPFVLEAKNTKTAALPAFVRQAETEADNAGFPYGVAVVKQRGKGAAHGHVVMSLETFAKVLLHMRAQQGDARHTP